MVVSSSIASASFSASPRRIFCMGTHGPAVHVSKIRVEHWFEVVRVTAWGPCRHELLNHGLWKYFDRSLGNSVRLEYERIGTGN